MEWLLPLRVGRAFARLFTDSRGPSVGRIEAELGRLVKRIPRFAAGWQFEANLNGGQELALMRALVVCAARMI
jgi:hypothetical protein